MIFHYFVVSMTFWASACAIQYEIILQTAKLCLQHFTK